MAYEVRLSNLARRDIDAALAWTIENFGEGQREKYWLLIVEALAEIARNPQAARTRPELHESARTFHLGRPGRSARHFFLLRIVENNVVEIARLLHDSMDLALHLPPGYGPSSVDAH